MKANEFVELKVSEVSKENEIEVRYERKKWKGGRKSISDKLPRVEIIHDIPKKNKNLHLAKIGAVKLAVTLLKMFPDLYKFWAVVTLLWLVDILAVLFWLKKALGAAP